MVQRRRDGVRPDMPTAEERLQILAALGGKPYWQWSCDGHCEDFIHSQHIVVMLTTAEAVYGATETHRFKLWGCVEVTVYNWLLYNKMETEESERKTKCKMMTCFGLVALWLIGNNRTEMLLKYYFSFYLKENASFSVLTWYGITEPVYQLVVLQNQNQSHSEYNCWIKYTYEETPKWTYFLKLFEYGDVSSLLLSLIFQFDIWAVYKEEKYLYVTMTGQEK